MAKITIKLPDEFLLKISSLADRTDEIVPRVLEAGATVVLKKIKANLLAVIGKDTKYESMSTGELVDSLGISPAKVNRDGNHDIKIGFKEPRKDGGSNAQIANIIEYGKSGQPAKPFLAPTKSTSRKECIEVMKAALESEMEQT